jgi:hypothetical protein
MFFRKKFETRQNWILFLDTKFNFSKKIKGKTPQIVHNTANTIEQAVKDQFITARTFKHADLNNDEGLEDASEELFNENLTDFIKKQIQSLPVSNKMNLNMSWAL